MALKRGVRIWQQTGNGLVFSMQVGWRSWLKLAEGGAGAPRPMKMGNILSPWHNDFATYQALRSEILRRFAIPLYALRRRFPLLRGLSRYASTATFSIDTGTTRWVNHARFDGRPVTSGLSQ
jgi:hypothetical protein